MADVTLADVSKVLGFNEKENPNGFNCYGTIISEDTEAGTYSVSINRDPDTTVECTRFAGASVGDVVLVTVLPNGTATVTGCVGGDKDALEGKEIAKRVNQYFWHTVSGDDPGTHITEIPMEEFVERTSTSKYEGGNTLIINDGVILRNGLKEQAKFLGGDNPKIVLGSEKEEHIDIERDALSFYNSYQLKTFSIFDTNDLIKTRVNKTNIFDFNENAMHIDPVLNHMTHLITREESVTPGVSIDLNFSNIPQENSFWVNTDKIRKFIATREGISKPNLDFVELSVYLERKNKKNTITSTLKYKIFGEIYSNIIYDWHSSASEIGATITYTATGNNGTSDSCWTINFKHMIEFDYLYELGHIDSVVISNDYPLFVSSSKSNSQVCRFTDYQDEISTRLQKYKISVRDNIVYLEVKSIQPEQITHDDYYTYGDCSTLLEYYMILPSINIDVGNTSCGFRLACMENNENQNFIDTKIINQLGILGWRTEVME